MDSRKHLVDRTTHCHNADDHRKFTLNVLTKLDGSYYR